MITQWSEYYATLDVVRRLHTPSCMEQDRGFNQS